MTITDDLVPEPLWQAIQPLLPTPPPRYGGRPASTTAPAWSASSTSCAPVCPGGCCPPASSAAPARSPRCCWRRWSTPSRRSRARAAAQGGLASARPSSTATRGTTTGAAVWRCAGAVSLPGLLGAASSPANGCHRYVVERSLAWLVGYRRLQVRYERRSDIMLGFLHLACALICLKSLNRTQV
jgi:hypothetical protein